MNGGQGMEMVKRDLRRLHAPRENGEKLMAPPATLVPEIAAGNIASRNGCSYDLQGRSLNELARLARREMLEAAYRWTASYRDAPTPTTDPASPIFLAGHQPQIVHPGVWLKNFTLGQLSRKHGATAVNLVVDSDVINAPFLQTPAGSIGDPRRVQVDWDRSDPVLPYEERKIEDRGCFASFGLRVIETIEPFLEKPFIAQYWPMVLTRAQATDNLGACLAQARHQLEGLWGLHTLEVPQSRICSSEAFQWFTAHLLAQLPRFRAIYNEAIREYRQLHHLRSASHPAPELIEEGEWLETPFWVWNGECPQRRRLFAQRTPQGMLLSNREGWQAELFGDPEDNLATLADQLHDLQRRGIKIRSRALITTLWARLFLSDLFIHGIGGAKYDEVTDRIIRQFFGIEPPGMMVVSGTLHLPIDPPQTAASPKESLDPNAIGQTLREMEFHPERFLDSARAAFAATRELIAEKQRWIETASSPDHAKQRCHAIRRVNELLQPSLKEQRDRLLEQQREALQLRAAHETLTWREYGFCLYPEDALRAFFESLP